MTSGIAWLDTSPEEQRRTREVLRLFEQHESRDELGIGQVRDVLSDAMFPGFSVLHTRARYYLFIPWCFQVAAESRGHQRLVNRAAAQERILAQTLSSSLSSSSGVIGARMGAAVKTLPSTIYWNGMATFGVLTRDVAPSDLTGATHGASEADEATGRALGEWHPTIPSCPDDFPKRVQGGFDLTAAEAGWLRERIVDGAGDSLLGSLAAAARPPENSDVPWTDPTVQGVASGQVADTLDHAHAFSVVMHGASTLYLNVIAEAYAGQFGDDDFSPEPYRQRFQWWVDELAQHHTVLDGWDADTFWQLIRSRNPRISPTTRRFVDDWAAMVRSGHIADAVDGTTDIGRRARTLITTRERTLKGEQSRLVNHRLLQAWGPADLGRQRLSQTPPARPQVTLTYRWPNVRRILRDVFDGLHRDAMTGGVDA